MVSSSPFCSISEMNTAAVALMQQANHNKAISSFETSLSCLRSHIVGRGKRGAMTLTRPQSQNYSGAETLRFDGIIYRVCINRSRDYSSIQDNLFAFYNRAFVLSPHADIIHGTACEVLLAPVLLYNMGLAYHCQGIRNGTSRELKLALQLYKASLQVFEDERQCFSSLCNQADLLLALINNMGHIFSHFYDLKGMDRCQRHLQILLESTPELFALFEEEEEDFTFFASALSSSYYKLHVAAAA
jgi:tetratricopeptide (TPR) repeat protein